MKFRIFLIIGLKIYLLNHLIKSELLFIFIFIFNYILNIINILSYYKVCLIIKIIFNIKIFLTILKYSKNVKNWK
jgi:hypothetical protein